MCNMICYIYTHSEKKGIYKFCLKKLKWRTCILVENSELLRKSDSWKLK